MIYLLVGGIFLVGILAILTQRNLINMVTGIIIAEFSIALGLALIGYHHGKIDPLIEELILVFLTAGLGSLILMTAIGMRLGQKGNTLDISKIHDLKE